MSITEYNHEKTMQMIREECFEDGRQVGFNDGINRGICHGETEVLIKILRANGEVPVKIEKQLREESNDDKINRCVDVITQVSVEERINAIARILNE